MPFTTWAEMLAHDAGRNLPLWKLAVQYERARGNLTEAEVIAKMVDIVRILRRSVQQGIAGTSYEDRVLGHQCGQFNDLMKAGRLLDGGALNHIILYDTALMEVKSSMGVIVAAPTAGACAALPGAVMALAETLELGEEEMAKAMLAAGLIGVFTPPGGHSPQRSAAARPRAVPPCMAAAALVGMAKGTLSGYSVGLGIPFLMMALFLERASGWTRKLGRHHRTIQIASGVFMILIGIMLFTNTMSLFAIWAFRKFLCGKTCPLRSLQLTSRRYSPACYLFFPLVFCHSYRRIWDT